MNMNILGNKAFYVIIASILFFFTHPVSAATYTIPSSGVYVMDAYDELSVAERKAIDNAKQKAIEQAGVYVKSYTRTEKAQVFEDEVQTIAGTVLQISKQKIERKVQSNGDVCITANIIAIIDTSAIDDALKQNETTRLDLIRRYESLNEAKIELEKRTEAFRELISQNPEQMFYDEEMRWKKKKLEREFLAIQEGRKGLQFAKNDELLQAYNAFESSIKLNPKLSDAYLCIGRLGTQSKAYKDAMMYHHISVELAPNNPWTYNSRAILYSDMNQQELALSDINKAISLKANCADLYGNRGLINERLGKFDEAIEDNNRSIELNPNVGITYSNRGMAYVGKGNIQQALLDFNKAIELNFNCTPAYYNRGILYAGITPAIKNRVFRFNIKHGIF